jgi:hypothetical protein
MKPVRIKYYGLIPMTRRAYLIATAIASVFAVTIWAVAVALGHLPPLNWPWKQDQIPGTGPWPWFYNHVYWFLLVCLVAEALDVFVTLRTFARKGALERGRLFREMDATEAGGWAGGEPETRITEDNNRYAVPRPSPAKEAEHRVQLPPDNLNPE